MMWYWVCQEWLIIISSSIVCLINWLTTVYQCPSDGDRIGLKSIISGLIQTLLRDQK